MRCTSRPFTNYTGFPAQLSSKMYGTNKTILLKLFSRNGITSAMPFSALQGIQQSRGECQSQSKNEEKRRRNFVGFWRKKVGFLYIRWQVSYLVNDQQFVFGQNFLPVVSYFHPCFSLSFLRFLSFSDSSRVTYYFSFRHKSTFFPRRFLSFYHRRRHS